MSASGDGLLWKIWPLGRLVRTTALLPTAHLPLSRDVRWHSNEVYGAFDGGVKICPSSSSPTSMLCHVMHVTHDMHDLHVMQARVYLLFHLV